MMRRFFIRRTIQYMLYLMIPTLCACLFFGIFGARQEEKMLLVQGENSLKAVQGQLELAVNSVMEQQIRMANDTSMMVALKKILQNKGKTSYGDAVYIRSLNTMLRSVVQSHSYLSSIFLYFDGYDSYFSSELKTTAITEEDERWLSVYQTMPTEIDGISNVREISGQFDGENEQVLSIYRRMLIEEGVIVVNLNLKKLQESLDRMSADMLEGLYLFDAVGNLLIADSRSQIKTEKQNQIKYILTQTPGRMLDGKWMKIQNERWLVQTDFFENYQIYLVSLIPSSTWYAVLSPLLGIFFLFFLLDSLIVVFISYITTKRNFRQIEYTLDLFAQAEQGICPQGREEAEPRDEYGVIMNNILHMFLRNSYLNAQLTEKQYKHKVMELSTLQYQINPHFLFNTLQTVELEVRKLTGDTTSMTQILHDLSDLLKYALANPERLVSLKEELRYLKEYMEIQQYRLGNRFLTYYEIEEDLMEIQMPRLLLQPLLENSIIHGIRESGHTGYIKVKAFPVGGWLRFSVIDNGIGMSREEIERLMERMEDENSKNIGITNVNRRLVLRYGEESRLKIWSKSGMGTCIVFRIPLETSQESSILSEGLVISTGNDKK